MKTWLFALLVAAAPQEDCEMAQKPVLYPGSVVSRNSQVRQAALQGGAYSAASAAPPATLGFLHTSTRQMDSAAGTTTWTVVAGRVHGFLEDDTVVGYSFGWEGTQGVAADTSVFIQVALYYAENGVGKLVPGSRVAETFAHTAASGTAEQRQEFIAVDPFAVDRSRVIIAAVWMKTTKADWTSVVLRGLSSGLGTSEISPALVGTRIAGHEYGLPQSIEWTSTTDMIGSSVIPGVGVLTKRNDAGGGVYLF